MLTAHRTFTTTAAPDRVHTFLADFENAEEWDPGTVECTRVDGDGPVGTRYRNVSSFLGRKTTVDYVTRELTAPSFVHFEGTNQQFTGHDRITLQASGGARRSPTTRRSGSTEQPSSWCRWWRSTCRSWPTRPSRSCASASIALAPATR